MRLGFFAALLADFLIVLLAPLIYTFPLWLVLGGFLCVFWYERVTGQSLSVRSGARMGWITGLFSFLIPSVLTLVLVLAARNGTLEKLAKEGASNAPFAQANIDQLLKVLHNPANLAANLFLSFVMFTALSMVGGAVGAKVLSKR